MPRIGFMLKVKSDRLEEYKRRHQEVWPEMLEALRQAGWHRYSLFLHDSGLLFGTFETPHSLERALAAMDATEVNARWQEQMAPFFELPPGGTPDRMLVPLEEVFFLE